MVCLRSIFAFVCLSISLSLNAQSSQFPDEPLPSSTTLVAGDSAADSGVYSSSRDDAGEAHLFVSPDEDPGSQSASGFDEGGPRTKVSSTDAFDTTGNPVPLELRQPQRILGFMPNFRSVAGGTTPHAPGWKYNFIVATQQATDYSSFLFLGLTSLTAEGMDMHSDLGKGIEGFYAYTWRGFLDKTDNTYLSAWLLPSALHEDTRYYAMGKGHSILMRSLYVISRQAVARTYGGRRTVNIAGLGGKVLTQVISRSYYPSSASGLDELTTKFGFSVMRDISFSAVREFYPDAAAHFIRKHREKVARLAAHDAAPTPLDKVDSE